MSYGAATYWHNSEMFFDVCVLRKVGGQRGRRRSSRTNEDELDEGRWKELMNLPSPGKWIRGRIHEGNRTRSKWFQVACIVLISRTTFRRVRSMPLHIALDSLDKIAYNKNVSDDRISYFLKKFLIFFKLVYLNFIFNFVVYKFLFGIKCLKQHVSTCSKYVASILLIDIE